MSSSPRTPGVPAAPRRYRAALSRVPRLLLLGGILALGLLLLGSVTSFVPGRHGEAAQTRAPATAPSLASPLANSPSYPSPIRHVFTIYLENEELSSVQSKGPFEMHLAKTYASASYYYSPCHPSAPNYLASTSGSTWQCGSDNYNSYTSENIFDLAQKAGQSWYDYSEAMPQACDTSDTFPNGLYVAHHNPAIFYKNIVGNSTLCKSRDVTFSSWYSAVNNSQIPSLAFFAPNMDNDGHQTGTAYADSWLKGWLSPYLNDSWFNSTVWFIVWDEGTTNNGPNGTSGGGHVYFAAVSPYSKGGRVWSNNTGHYDLLATEEWLLGMKVGACGHNDNSSSYPPMKGLFNFTTSLSASASAKPSSGSAPLAVQFTGSATGGVSPYSFSWTFGDGSSSTSQSPSHTYSAAGKYVANLTVTDSKKNSSLSSVSISVSKAAALAATASATPTSGAAPLAVQFTGGASGGRSPYSFAWSFGDGGSSTLQSPSHTYTSVGNYTATLTVTDAAKNSSSSSVALRVSNSSGPLSVSVSATPSSGSAPLFVQFHASPSGGSSPYSYSWKFAVGGTHSSTLQSPNDTYLYTGNYTATVTLTDSAGATASAQVKIAVTPAGAPLSASASAIPTSGTSPLAVVFTGSASGGSSPYSFSWTMGDGGSASVQDPSHTYSSAGNYTAKLTVTDSAAHTATARLTITVKSLSSGPLTASASASPTSGAGPLTVRFTGTVSGGTSPYSYYWTFAVGGTHSSTQLDPSDTYYYKGTYTATFKVTDSLGHTASAQVTITVNSTAPGYSTEPGGPAQALLAFLESGVRYAGEVVWAHFLLFIAAGAAAGGFVVYRRRTKSRTKPAHGKVARSETPK